MKFRKEKDSIGYIDVPAKKYWAAQTQRSSQNFKIGGQQMPKEVINAFAILKKAAALTNAELGVLPMEKATLIGKVCEEILKGEYLHPNDDVNKSQSSNDTFPTAMHISAYKMIMEVTIPGLEGLRDTLNKKSKKFAKVVKIGRTHFMDATPVTVGQELSGYVSQLDHGIAAIKNTLKHLGELALGGTAVGTGLSHMVL